MIDLSRIRNVMMWSAIDKIAASGIQLVLNLILARLIIPEEYALVAMISIFIAIGQTFVDSGFSQSLIHKQNRTSIDISTVFYFNIVIAFIFYLLIFSIAPFIAKFYNNGIFISLTRIVGLNLIVSSFAIVQRALLIIKTDFKTQATISLISIIISGIIGIFLAYRGYGVWAMVVQTLLNQLLAVLLLWIIVRWHPKFVFSKSSFKELFSYGSKLLLSRIINTICQNIHTILIGKFYSTSSVAYFNNSNQISLYSACYLNEIVQRALFPIQCEQQGDIQGSKELFLKMLRLSSFIIFPLMMGIIVLSEPFITIVLTDKWIGMVKFMQIIAFAYMWYPLMSSNQMFNVLGRTDLYLRTEIIKKIFFAAIVVVTLFWGVVAMCWGIVLYNVIEIVVTIIILKKIFPITFIEIVENIMPSIFFSLCMAIIVYTTNMLIDSFSAKLLLGGIIGIVSYLGMAIFFKSKDLKDIIRIIKVKK